MTGLVDAMKGWASHPGVVVGLTLFSVLALAGGAFAVPWLVRRLPADYLVRPGSEGKPTRQPGARIALAIGRNIAGVVLVLAGLALLVLPGQGMVTLIVGLLLLDVPGKKTLERKLLTARPVLAAVDAMRRRAGKPPLVRPA